MEFKITSINSIDEILSLQPDCLSILTSTVISSLVHNRLYRFETLNLEEKYNSFWIMRNLYAFTLDYCNLNNRQLITQSRIVQIFRKDSSLITKHIRFYYFIH